MIGVLVALTGPEETDVVRRLDAPGSGTRVVRRCADVPEVLAAAVAGLGELAVLAADLPGVDRPAVMGLRAAGVECVLVAAPEELERCAALGATEVVTSADALVAAVLARTVRARGSGGGPVGLGTGTGTGGGPGGAPPGGRTVDATGARSRDEPDVEPDDAGGAEVRTRGRASPPSVDSGPADPDLRPPGRLVAVWGPPGAPGRTTVAVSLAAEIALLGRSALLVDADTDAPSVTQTLGLLDDSSAVAAAARHASHGRLDAPTLLALCPRVEPGMRVLTGLTRADRWRELPAAALDVLWEVARDIADVTVVDLGPGLDEAAGTDQTYGPRRHQAATSALGAADVVVVVGSGEPVGMRRLVMALGQLTEAGVQPPERVVLVNRLRASAAGPAPDEAVQEALARFGGVTDAVIIPDDRPATDRALLQGRTLAEVAPTSAARLALEQVARRLAGESRSRPRARFGLLRMARSR
ncbi:AAA family ATPase [Georgenia muralis]